MKKLLALILALTLIFALAACNSKDNGAGKDSPPPDTGKQNTESPPTESQNSETPPVSPETPDTSPAAEPVELIVFAAASMTETLTEIAELYKTEAPHVTLTFNFDSSGTLKTQIEEGADCDVFISAAQKQMNELTDTSFVDADTRFNLVENQVALVVPAGNPAGITTFDDAAVAEMIALGNSDVPVGQYSEEIFTNMGVWDTMQGSITFGSNVKEVTSWVSEGVVDCGVVYSTDAVSAGLEIVAYAPAGTLKTPVLYPAAVLNVSQSPDEAAAFLAFLQTPAAIDVFKSVGFGIPS